MLTQQLRELEAADIINRKVYNQVPPKVEYSLSDYGQSLSIVLSDLCTWGEMYVDMLKKRGEDVELVNNVKTKKSLKSSSFKTCSLVIFLLFSILFIK